MSARRRSHLRAADVAAELGVSVRTVRRWIADGRLLSTRIGGARLIAEDDLHRLLESEKWSTLHAGFEPVESVVIPNG
jgi:excisionase family DNA binding protein